MLGMCQAHTPDFKDDHGITASVHLLGCASGRAHHIEQACNALLLARGNGSGCRDPSTRYHVKLCETPQVVHLGHAARA